MSALAVRRASGESASAAVVGSLWLPLPADDDRQPQGHDCDDTNNRREADTTRRREAPAHSCAMDALHVIFSFLPLCDVSSCAASCRRWSTAAAAGSGVGRHRIDVRLHTLRALATSPLRALVGEMNLASSTLVAADRVESVWSAFPHLTALTCCLDWRLLTPDTELRFPTTLRALDISIVDGSVPWSVLDVVLSLAVRSPLTRLRVAANCTGDAPPTGAVEKLLAVQDTLVDLELGVKGISDAWRADHIAVFRSLPHLTRLAVSRGNWSAEEIDLLTAAPTPHHLRSVDLHRTSSFGGLDAQSLAIARLTSLSSLRLDWLRCDPALLARMTQLETLAIDHCGERSQAVAQAIAQCTALTDLTLGDVRIFASAAPSWMREFLPALVRLRRLQIPWMPVDIECGAAASHLAHTLEELIVDTPQRLSSLRHLRALRRLRSLRLNVDLSSRAAPAVARSAAPRRGRFMINCSATVQTPISGSGSGETIGVAEEDDETVSLPDLEQLTMTIYDEGDDCPDLGRFFGRMPALRRADLTHARRLRQQSSPPHMMKMIKRMPYITLLKLEDERMRSEELSEVLPSLLSLRELTLTTYAGRDLAFLSSPSSGHLGRTLERLAITSKNESVSPLDFRHLHSLGALQDLHLNLRLHAGGHTTGVIRQSPTDSPRGLASLRELRVRLFDAGPATRPTIDFGRLFGPMPHLQTATIHCDTIISPATLADGLAHSTLLTELTLTHEDIAAAHLTAVVPPLRRLRCLYVSSSSLASLSFLSAPHLASTMQELNLYPIDQSSLLPPASELHHLRSLAHLRSLTVTLRMRPGDRDDRVARDDYESHRCELWPHAHQYDLTFFDESNKRMRR